jgi:hypothetical protein
MTRNPQWEEEGALENMLGAGIDLLFYIDRRHGVFHYVLLVNDVKMYERRFQPRLDLDDSRILDGVKREWGYAQVAKQLNDTMAQFAFTWRGLRLLFPQLPEEPLLSVTE